MQTQFEIDLNNARGAEELVYNIFSTLDKERKYRLVGAERAYFYKGDIVATDASGKEIYIEVKDDSRIADTGNVLCEEENYFKKHDCYKSGGMYNNTDIYCVVSKQARKIYVIDFKILQKNYRSGKYIEINHPTEITYCYLLELSRIKQYGGLIATLDY